MAKLIYLVHRMPYPPNKGDKVRSYHLLEHLRRQHEVHVGTFVDDPEDEAHVPALRERCASLYVARLNPTRAKVASLSGLLDGQALTLRYFRHAGLRAWVEATARHRDIDATVVFSSSMTPYAERLGVPMLVDFVDVDSAKWTQYARHHRWPVSWLYRREGAQLLAHERAASRRAMRSFFVTEKEAALFRELAPECAAGTDALGNGVDADYFSPDAERVSPFGADELPVVFTGAMDYWPNIDAVTWFARDVLPLLRRRWPRLRFHIVGRSPSQAVRSLTSPAVAVTGTVHDVRPYLQHAAVVVAPLRLARGVQNKVLEAMAMARPVVAALACAEAIEAQPGVHLLTAGDAADFERQVNGVLIDAALARHIGQAARACVLQHYSWTARLSGLDRYIQTAAARQPLAA